MALKPIAATALAKRRLCLAGVVILALVVTFETCSRSRVADETEVKSRAPEQRKLQISSTSGIGSLDGSRIAANREVVPAPQQPVVLSLRWSSLTANSDASEIVRAAEESTHADDRLSAIRIFGICGSASSRADENISERIQLAYPSGSNGWLSSDALYTAIANARDRLTRFCKPIESGEMQARSVRLGARIRAEASPSKTLILMDPTSGQSAWSQEQVQAFTTILSQPELYSSGVDVLMERLTSLSKLNGWDSLSASEIEVVKTLVYQEMTGDRNPDSLRNLFACMNGMTCEVTGPAGMAAAQNKKFASAAQTLVDIIRKQQWSQLGL